MKYMEKTRVDICQGEGICDNRKKFRPPKAHISRSLQEYSAHPSLLSHISAISKQKKIYDVNNNQHKWRMTK